MLYVKIGTPDDANPKDKKIANYELQKIINSWDGARDLSGCPVVPVYKIVGLVGTQYLIYTMDDIWEPREEAIATRYALAHRRVGPGKFSLLEILNSDQSYFRDQIGLAREAENILRNLANGHGSRSELTRLHGRILHAPPIDKIKYRFEKYLADCFDIILSDIPELGHKKAIKVFSLQHISRIMDILKDCTNDFSSYFFIFKNTSQNSRKKIKKIRADL